MQQKKFLSNQAKIACSVKIEETISLLSKKHGKTINFGIGQSCPEAIPYDFLRDTFNLIIKSKQKSP